MSKNDAIQQQKHLPFSQKLRGHLALARISNSPTVITNVLAGAALAGVYSFTLQTALLAAAMVLFYTGGMYLNDLMDITFDQKERPERPLPSGLIPFNEALIVTILLFTIGLVLLALVNWWAFTSGLILTALIILYDKWHKNNPISPLIMASTRMMVYVTAYVSFMRVSSGAIIAAALLMLGYIIGLTFIAKSEGKGSLTAQWPALLLFLPVLYFAFQIPLSNFQLLFVALFAGWVIHCRHLVRAQKFGQGIVRLIAGISLLDGLVMAAAGAGLLTLIVLPAFGLTLFLQRYIKGT